MILLTSCLLYGHSFLAIPCFFFWACCERMECLVWTWGFSLSLTKSFCFAWKKQSAFSYLFRNFSTFLKFLHNTVFDGMIKGSSACYDCWEYIETYYKKVKRLTFCRLQKLIKTNGYIHPYQFASHFNINQKDYSWLMLNLSYIKFGETIPTFHCHHISHIVSERIQWPCSA